MAIYTQSQFELEGGAISRTTIIVLIEYFGGAELVSETTSLRGYFAGYSAGKLVSRTVLRAGTFQWDIDLRLKTRWFWIGSRN